MANQSLSGVRILDFTWAWAGPFCNLQLAYLGAEIIRVESTLRPCVTRFIPPFADNITGPNRAGYFNQYNQGKKSILMNLANPDAIALAGEREEDPSPEELIGALIFLCSPAAGFVTGTVVTVDGGFTAFPGV